MAVPSATPTPSATPSAPEGISDSGTIALTSGEGYTANIDYSLSIPAFTESVANEAPGFSSVTFSANTTATVTNTTPGRNNPTGYHWQPFALYPLGSPACTIGNGLRHGAADPTFQDVALDGLTTSDGGPAKYCALALTPDMSFGQSMERAATAPLAAGESQPLTVVPGAPLTDYSTIIHVPEKSVPQLIAGLAAPAKIVYAITHPAYAGKVEGDQKPQGEACNVYTLSPFGAAQPVQSDPFEIFVPAKYAHVCP